MENLTKEQKAEVKKILKENGFNTSLKNKKHYESNKAMGSGGKGQIKFMPRLKEIRIQLTYGYGRWNYADVLIIEC